MSTEFLRTSYSHYEEVDKIADSMCAYYKNRLMYSFIENVVLGAKEYEGI